MAKKYFWLKLKDDFFTDIRMKKLRRNAGGATYTLIYLKMQLLSLKKEGILLYEEVEDSFYEEIAFKIDEDPVDVEFTLMFLMKHNLLEEVRENEFALIETIKSIGSETDVAERVRKHREEKKEKHKLLQCNATETIGNTEIEKEKEKELEKPSRSKYEICDMENAELLFNLMRENNPDVKKPNLETWAYEMGLIRRRDNRTDEQIKYLINWTQKDDFWHRNILSPSKLRKQWDQLVLKVKESKSNNNNKKMSRMEELAYGITTGSENPGYGESSVPKQIELL